MSDRRQQFDDQRYLHFVTFTVYKRRNLLDLDQPKRILLGTLNHLLESLNGKCIGFVIMSNHVHAILGVDDSATLVRFIHGWKRMSSFRIRHWYATEAPNYFDGFGQGDKFWQPKYYAFHLHSRDKIEEKLQYMHLNPVRAGLVTQAANWPWSSAAWYHLQKPVGVPIEWVDC